MEFAGIEQGVKKYRYEITAEINKVLDSHDFIDGQVVEEFERELSSFCERKFAVGCASGTDALWLCLKAARLKQNAAVFVSPFSFVASADTIVRAGFKPIFIDIDNETLCIDPVALENSMGIAQSMGMETGAVIAVDIFGNPCDYVALHRVCEKFGAVLIADGAQSMGCQYNGKRGWQLADFVATSFFPSKPLGGWGDAGAVLGNAGFVRREEIKSLARHGRRGSVVNEIGINSRLDTIQAAILRVKLRHLTEELQNRRTIAKIYRRELEGKVHLQKITEKGVSSYAIMAIMIKNRDKVRERLALRGIPSRVYYRRGIHQEPAFNTKVLSFYGENCAKICESILCLPMHGFLSREEVLEVCEGVLDAIDE